MLTQGAMGTEQPFDSSGAINLSNIGEFCMMDKGFLQIPSMAKKGGRRTSGGSAFPGLMQSSR